MLWINKEAKLVTCSALLLPPPLQQQPLLEFPFHQMRLQDKANQESFPTIVQLQQRLKHSNTPKVMLQLHVDLMVCLCLEHLVAREWMDSMPIKWIN